MSRYAPSEDSYSRYAPSSPISYAGDDTQPADPDVKPMRLKVLYTTDDKTNCMARWPKVIQVRSAFLDEKTEIGVVDLRTCIKAIVASSPELVASLGHDYTVYAYDYSEYETPLVGQGMLSWVLASSPSTSSAPASQASTMVTGRVAKNVNALFGRDSVAQTLEVKLRLVPVPTVTQKEYLDSLKKYRDVSRAMPENFDPQAWTDFLKANPQALSSISRSGPPSPTNVPDPTIGLQNVQRLMQHQPGPRPQYSHSRRGSLTESILSREASPTPSVQSAFPEPSRPTSRTSHRELRRTASTGQLPGSDFENEDNMEDGPARKRARITQVKRPRKHAGFGNQVESLRVAASTANSVRVLQPTAIRPGMAGLSSLEEPPRAPTPVARASSLMPRHAAKQPRSGLSRFATVAQEQFPRDAARTPRSFITSPEGNSVIESSPGEDPGSSPPVPAGGDYMTAPSSPQLPRMPLHEDSGFMSGAMDDDNDNNTTNTQLKIEPPSSSAPDATSQQQHRSLRPRRIAAKLTRAESSAAQMTTEERRAEISRKNALCAIGWRRVQSFSEGQTANANRVSTDPESEGALQPGGPVRSKHANDKEAVKRRVQARLMNAIEAGEKPPMCENCGTLDAHTWRKAYKKRHCGSPADVRVGRGPGAVLTVLVDERDARGEITIFSIIKKSLLDDDVDFQEMLLCNPCGLWLNKRGEMRPPRMWNRADGSAAQAEEVGAHTAGSKRPRDTDDDDERSVMPLPSEFTEPPSEAHLPTFQTDFEDIEASVLLQREDSNSQEPENEPELPTLPEARQLGTHGNAKSRSDSEMPANAIIALQRAIRSSPGQAAGSRHSPIEVDDTPNSTRRTLFPSPKARGPLGSIAGNRGTTLRDSPDAPRQKRLDMGAPVISIHLSSGKENMMPPPPPKRSSLDQQERAATPTPRQDEPDYFGDVFKENNGPSTPSRGHNITLPIPKSPSNPFRTPPKGTLQKAFSSAEKAYLHGNPRTPTRTPSRTPVENTPGSSADTPFTRQLKNLFSGDPMSFDLETSPSKVFGDIPMIGEDFTTDWPMTTDMPMPSSPPVARHSGSNAASQLPKTPGAKGGAGAGADDEDSPDWDDLGLGKTPGVPESAKKDV